MARLRIGLTGGIASGKSTVAAILADLGAVIIDADVLSREVVQPGTPGLDKIIERFGNQVLRDGHLDRSILGELVFQDPNARRDLEEIVHPLVRQRAAMLEAQAGPRAVVVQVIPLLVETGQASEFDSVWVVDAPEESQIARLRRRDGMTDAQARDRVAAQVSRSTRLAAADVVVENLGGPPGYEAPAATSRDESERENSSVGDAPHPASADGGGLHERVAAAYRRLVGP